MSERKDMMNMAIPAAVHHPVVYDCTVVATNDISFRSSHRSTRRLSSGMPEDGNFSFELLLYPILYDILLRIYTSERRIERCNMF